jgi:membrane protease YdiL (CAAX protease family)
MRASGLLPPLALFLAFSHGWTFAFWSIAAAMPGSVWDAPGRAWFLAGGAGILLAGLATAAWTGGRAGVVDLGRRTVDPRRGGVAAWSVALLFAPVSTLVAAGVVGALDPAAAPLAPAAPAGLLALLGLAATLLVLGPLPEEIGWRGGLLDHLLAHLRPPAATAVVALAWWSWHWPLHLLPGYFEPFAHPPGLWSQLVGIAAASVLMTWLYLDSRRSVLIAVAFHWSGNLSGEVLRPSPAVDAVQLGLSAAAAALVVALGFPRVAPGVGRR